MAALTDAMVPAKVIVTSAMPSPALNVSPVVPFRLTVPLPALSVTATNAPPASASPMTIPLPPALEKTKAVPSDMLCAPGTVLSGASFTAVTVKLKLCPPSALP